MRHHAIEATNGDGDLKQLVRALWVVVILAAGCGGDDEDATSDPPAEPTATLAAEPTATLAAEPTATQVAEPTATPAAEPSEEEAPPEETEAVNADPVVVTMRESGVETDTTVYKTGTINFEVTNPEDVPHIFGVARGESYEDLPKLANGAIDREALGADFIGKTGILLEGLGRTKEISFDLNPGGYVFYCNAGDDEDEVSHAARGEVLSVTVVE